MIKAQKNLFSKLILLKVFLLVVLVDQLSKYWAQFQDLVVINSGISFALFSSSGWLINISNYFFISLLVLLVFLLIILIKKFPKLSFLSTIFIAAAFSNILDRIIFSGVRDWLPVPVLGLKNNLADWLMFLLVILYIKKYANRNNL